MPFHRLSALLATSTLAAALVGCSTSTPLIADKSLWLSPSVSISHEAIVGAAVAGAVLWYVVDPMAPTWGVSLQRMSEDRYRISLKQKTFAPGGDGEAQQVFHRAAERLAEENGYAGYRVLNYTESLESGPLLAQRTCRGVVQLTNAPDAIAAY